MWTARCLVSLGRDQAILLMLEGSRRLGSFGGECAHHNSDPPFGFGKVERYNTSYFVRGVVFPTTEAQQFPSFPYVIVFSGWTSLFKCCCYR